MTAGAFDRRFVARALIGLAALVGLYWAVFAILIATAPLPYSEMDINNDGTVTFGEAFYAWDHKTRPVQVNGRECVEILSPKDGLSVKTICPS